VSDTGGTLNNMAVISERNRNHTPQVAVRMTPELRAAAEAVAGDGRTLSDVIRDALAEYLAAHGQRVA
jgi:hypothetical protein